jgi:Fe2+ transport system protein FeoA
MNKTSVINSYTLNQLHAGTKAVVRCISCRDKKLGNKLLAMGIVAGTIIEVLRIAPLGDPMKIKALGYNLSLRLSEAESVEVLPL